MSFDRGPSLFAVAVGLAALALHGCTGADPLPGAPTSDAGNVPPPSGLPACPDAPGYVCTPAVIPPGWNVVGRTADPTQPCPERFGGPEVVLSRQKADPSACGCTCEGTPACTSFTLARFFGNDSTCSSNPTTVLDVTYSPAAPDACRVGGYVTPTDKGHLKLITPPPSATECTPASQPSRPPPVVGDRERLCTATDPGPFRTCATGVCVPGPSASYAVCVAREGDVDCPTGFPVRTVAGTGDAPFTDTRGCSACTCKVEGDCSATVKFASDDGCIFGPSHGTAGCDKEGALVDQTHFKFAAYQNSRKCVVDAPSAPTGGIAANAPRTICCP